MSKGTRRCAGIESKVLVVGVDIGKHSQVAVGLAGDGQVTKARTISTSASGFQELLGWMNGWQAWSKAESVVVAMEPTGHYSELLADWLTERGVSVLMVSPLWTCRAKELDDGTSRKTDAKDARVIADCCRRGLYRPWKALDEVFGSLRALSQARRNRVDRQTQVVNQVHQIIDRVFPELRYLMGVIRSVTAQWLLANASTPEAVLAYSEEALAAELKKASRGRLGLDRAQALREAAATSVGLRKGRQTWLQTLKWHLKELRELQTQIQELEAQMEECLQQVPYVSYLLSIPRLGKVTLATLLGEFGDFRNYQAPAQLLAMAGLDLVEKSSGQHRGYRHTSHRGRSYARQMLYMAALRMGADAFAPQREKLKSRGVHSSKIIGANMCRLLRVMFALVKTEQMFDREKLVVKPKETEERMVA